jgi:putative phosphoesterase
MLIAVVSDSHDNIWKLDRALAKMNGIDVVIHCGDLCSPFMVKRLGEAFNGHPIHIVWGNNDGDVRLICQIAAHYEKIFLHGDFAHLELDGVRVAVNHYPEIARGLAATGTYDLVCYGHDHTVHQSRVGDCVLLNPGELMGMYGESTYALFDTASREVEIVKVF